MNVLIYGNESFLLNQALQKKIKEINLVLLDFQFKKTTRQPIKPHEIKIAKKERARLSKRIKEKTKIIKELLTPYTLLEKTLNGEEPSDFIEEINNLKFQNGESPESLIKAYKWIWGQEDVNYPNGEGRKMSWKGIEELKNKLV